MQHTIHVKVEGRVQGVFFRDYTRRKAMELGLTGWVKNCSDGSVETLLCGEEANVQMMLHWLLHGSPASRVNSLTSSEVAPKTVFQDFSIRY